MDRDHLVNIFILSGLIFLAPLAYADVDLRKKAPSQYLVKKGDTLWDISGVFLKSPWRWPSLWEENQQIKNPDLIYPNDVIYLLYSDGKPYLTTNQPSANKLVPKVRSSGRFTPITSIPKKALNSFVRDHRIVATQRITPMPYVLASAGLRQLIAGGDDIFIRGILDPEINQYDIYRVGKVYGANQGLAAENTEIVNIGQVQIISKQGDISRAKVLNSNGLIKKGDIIVRPQTLRFKPLYYLAAAPAGIKGQIIGAVDDAYKIARHDGVVVNLGSASSVYAGHIFSVLKKAEKVQDPRTNELITIGNQIIAELMIVNVFENLSYGIVLNAAEIVSVGDVIIGIE